MDATAMGGRVQTWVHERFGGQGEVSKEELVTGLGESDLPEEAREAVRDLPEGSWPISIAVHHIVDILETRAGGGARGNANLPEADGYGRR